MVSGRVTNRLLSYNKTSTILLSLFRSEVENH